MAPLCGDHLNSHVEALSRMIADLYSKVPLGLLGISSWRHYLRLGGTGTILKWLNFSGLIYDFKLMCALYDSMCSCMHGTNKGLTHDVLYYIFV